MKALITGASSGLGKDFAYALSKMGYDLILVARRKERLETIQDELSTNVEIVPLDISSTYNCTKLFNKFQNDDIDIVINNAGFGIFGEFTDTSLDKELDLIDLNIKAVHTLTKLFLQKFTKENKGYILNVASLASFTPGPLMATYYASKSYVLNLTTAISEELRRSNSNVYVGVLCPGPVDTEFNSVAKVKFKTKSLKSIDVVNYALKKMFERKLIIIPGKTNRLYKRLLKLTPLNKQLKIIYNIQTSSSNK